LFVCDRSRMRSVRFSVVSESCKASRLTWKGESEYLFISFSQSVAYNQCKLEQGPGLRKHQNTIMNSRTSNCVYDKTLSTMQDQAAMVESSFYFFFDTQSFGTEKSSSTSDFAIFETARTCYSRKLSDTDTSTTASIISLFLLKGHSRTRYPPRKENSTQWRLLSQYFLRLAPSGQPTTLRKTMKIPPPIQGSQIDRAPKMGRCLLGQRMSWQARSGWPKTSSTVPSSSQPRRTMRKGLALRPVLMADHIQGQVKGS
jgi:hypothetical protein